VTWPAVRGDSAGTCRESDRPMSGAGSGYPPASADAAVSAWPLVSGLEFAPLPTAVPCARLHTRFRLADWNLSHISDAAELIVSELLTNAITATQAIHSGYPVRLWVLSDNSRIVIMVGDASPQPPRRIDPTDDTEGGRGLLLVEALSSNWGWYLTRQHQIAKIVWAELRTPPGKR
jgi:anti-sigma regulatory factor (Ser/Thr protein kinase)